MDTGKKKLYLKEVLKYYFLRMIEFRGMIKSPRLNFSFCFLSSFEDKQCPEKTSILLN